MNGSSAFPESLVVVKPGALGDTLLVAPSLRAARTRLPGVPITVIGTAPAIGLLAAFGVADAVFSFDRLRLFGPPTPVEPDVRGGAVLAFISGGPGESDPFVERGASRVIWRPSRPGDGGPHVVHHLHAALEALIGGLPPPRLDPFAVPPLSRPPVPVPYIVLAPGAGAVEKQLPLTRFERIAAEAEARGVAPIFVAGEVEVERGLVKRYPEAYPRWVSPTLTDLAGLLAGAAAFFGNDSGPGHLAALLGTQTTVFFGPTNPDVWSPWGVRVTIERF